MDANNWPGQVIGGETGVMEGGEWRTELQHDSRQRIVNKIMGALKRRLPFSGQEGLQELKKIAVRFEERCYTEATSLPDYLRRISLKMLSMENKSQNPIANPLQAIAASSSQDPVWNSTGQGVTGNMYANSQRQIQDSQQYLYNQHLMNQQFGQGGVSQSMMQSQMHQQQQQQQQQNLLQPNQHQSVHMLQQSMANMFLNQAQPSQSQPMQQQLMSQIPSQPGQLQQQMGLQQQPNMLPRDMHPMLQQQTAVDQQKQLLQPQRVMPEVSLSSLDSSSQTASAGGDWQDEIYQKIKSMHELYYPELNEMYQRIAAKLQQHDAIPQQPKNEQLEQLRFLKLMVERLIMFLWTIKNDILPNHKEKIVGVEKQIVNIVNSNRPTNAVASLQQGQLNQSHMHAMQQQPQMSQMHSN